MYIYIQVYIHIQLFQFFTFSLYCSLGWTYSSPSSKGLPDAFRPLQTPPLTYAFQDFLLLICSYALPLLEKDVLSTTDMNIHFYNNSFKGHSSIFLNSSAILYTFSFSPVTISLIVSAQLSRQAYCMGYHVTLP